MIFAQHGCGERFVFRRRGFHRLLIAGAVCFACSATAQTVDLATATNGSDAFCLWGPEAGDQAGQSVSCVGDFNQDNYADFIIGAFHADGPSGGPDCGVSLLFFGHEGYFPAAYDLGYPPAVGTGLFQGGDNSDESGRSVAGIGGFKRSEDDAFAIGAPLADGPGESRPGAGECYVIHSYTKFVYLGSINPSVGLTVYGATAGDALGRSVSGAGHIYHTYRTDLLVGAPGADGAGEARNGSGEVYLIFGDSTPPAIVDIATLDAAMGTIIYGADAGDRAGFGTASISGIGDFNGDGHDDFAIGADMADGPSNSRTDCGEVYVIFGKEDGIGASLDLRNLDGTNGFVMYGVDAGDNAGYSLSAAGDVNGDGLFDIVIGAWNADGPANSRTTAGDSYIVFGRSTPFGPSMELSSITSSTGLIVYGAEAGDRAGWNVSGAGCITGDGFSDVIIGAYRGDGESNGRTDSGESYLLFWRSSGFASPLDLASFTEYDGRIYFGATAGDRSGFHTSTAGDTNGDGSTDFLISSNLADGPENSRPSAGEVHALLGSVGARGTWKYYLPADDTAGRKSVGVTGDGSDNSFPASRCWLEIFGGSGKSLQTVTLDSSGSAISNLPGNLGDLWHITSNRDDVYLSYLSLRYLQGSLAESPSEWHMSIYEAPTPSGPWTQLSTFSDAQHNVANTFLMDVPNGYYAIAKDTTAPTMEVIPVPQDPDSDYVTWAVNFSESTWFNNYDLEITGPLNGEILVKATDFSDEHYMVYVNIYAKDVNDTVSIAVVPGAVIQDESGNQVTPVAFPPVTVVNFQSGDVNHDGAFNIQDVALLADANLGLATLP